MNEKQRLEALEALQMLDGVVAQVTGLPREGVIKLMNATATIRAAIMEGQEDPLQDADATISPPG